MRYEVGKTYTFLRVLFTPGKDRFLSVFVPWEDTLNDIQVINLLCKEHHKVGLEFDPEDKKHDGFIFEDANGQIWYNQYPTAAYGQTDDSQDYRVIPHFEEWELFKTVEGSKILVRDSVGNPIRRTDDEARNNWDFFEDMFWKSPELAVKQLGNLYRCINPMHKKQLLDQSKRDQLQTHLDQLIEKVEAASGQKVIFEPVVFRYLDERPPESSKFITARLSGDASVAKLNDKYVPAGAIRSREEYEKLIPVKARFFRVSYCAHPRAPEPKLYEAERSYPTGISETGDDIEDQISFFHFRYAGRHHDSASFLDWNVSRLNDYNNSFMFAHKKDAEAYFAFVKDPANAHCFK